MTKHQEKHQPGVTLRQHPEARIFPDIQSKSDSSCLLHNIQIPCTFNSRSAYSFNFFIAKRTLIYNNTKNTMIYTYFIYIMGLGFFVLEIGKQI